jgi:ABC-type multidrug transport system ATPase subunit
LEQKRIYSIAFELVIEATVNHQKFREAHESLMSLAVHLDKFFSTSEFSQNIDKKDDFYKSRLIVEDESLFIQESHIPYLVQSEILCTEFDKLSAYLIIRGWVKEFKIPNELIYHKIGNAFRFNYRTYSLINGFISDNLKGDLLTDFVKISRENPIEFEKLEGHWVEENEPENSISENIYDDKQKNSIHAIYLSEFNSFVIKCGARQSSSIKKNNRLCPDKFCIVQSGDSIEIGNEITLTFTDVKKKYIQKKYSKNFYLTALDAEWTTNRKTGIRPFNFIGQPGELIGVIGSEGTGKSTLLALLGGYIKPHRGNVFVNGYNLNKFSYQLSGMVGYVPEEDLLFHELTVRENLVMSAQLYLTENSLWLVHVLVDDLLKELDLWEIRSEIVGGPKDKTIQPGQRRLLNIALELVRDPQILIIDNAISSLSMSDSTKVIEILSRYTFKGKLIVTSITQTNQEAFELFDKLLVLDKGGLPIYSGSRHSALNFFLKLLPEGLSAKFSSENAISPDIIFNILDLKLPDSESKYESNRYVDSETLYKSQYNQNLKAIHESRKRMKISGNLSHPPRLERQFFFFSLRNFKVKLAQKREIYFSIFSAPVLSSLIALILKSPSGGSYTFGQNPNIPIFFFISTLVLFFIGLSMSIKEIITERHVLKKEEHLNLSIFSYINSKILYLFLIIAIQSLLYTIIANSILEMNQLWWHQWLVYYSVAISGALLGLIFSMLHKKTESILIKTIPITLVIIVLLGGGWIPFKNLYKSNKRYTPLVTDFIVSKLAYESLVVDQFINNGFQENFNEVDKIISNGSFNSYHILPKLNSLLDESKLKLEKNKDSAQKSLETVKNYFLYIKNTNNFYPFEFIDQLNKNDINEEILSDAQDYIEYLDYNFFNRYNSALKKKKAITDSLIQTIGTKEFDALKQNNENNAIVQLARNSNTRESFFISGNECIRLTDPIFKIPSNNYGRTTLYCAQKRFNNQLIDTYVYNLSILWLLNFAFYILLISGAFSNIVYRFHS